MFCFNCGAKVPDGSLFCGECGTKLSIPVEEPKVVEEPVAAVEPEVVEEPAAAVEPEVVEEPAATVEPKVVEKPAATVKPAAVEYVFCMECGAKNEAGSKFCEECGNILFEEEPKVVEEQPVIVKKKVIRKKAVNPGSKRKNIVIIVEAVILIALIAVFYMMGNAYSKPEKVVNKYVKACQKGDWETVYDLYEDDDMQFITKDNFVNAMKKNAEEMGTMTQYTLTPDMTDLGDLTNFGNLENSENSGQKMTSAYILEYSTTKNESEYETLLVNLQLKKHYLFFDKWELDASNIMVKDLYIMQVPGVTLELDGVALSNEYLTDYGDESNGVKAYKIPAVLSGTHELSMKADSGIIEEGTQTFEVEYGSYCYEPDVKYKKEAIKEAVSTAKKSMKEIYTAVLEKKGAEAIKAYCANADAAQSVYDEIAEDFSYYLDEGKAIDSYKISIPEAKASTQAEGGSIRVEINGGIDLKYHYKEYSGDYSNSNSIYGYVYMVYQDNEWKVLGY